MEAFYYANNTSQLVDSGAGNRVVGELLSIQESTLSMRKRTSAQTPLGPIHKAEGRSR
jgi:hypothetical protein